MSGWHVLTVLRSVIQAFSVSRSQGLSWARGPDRVLSNMRDRAGPANLWFIAIDRAEPGREKFKT